MPLPDAEPKPAGSNIYHQLNSTKLGDLTNAEFAIVRDPLFLNDRSEDELRRLALIGQARQSLSASSSGPIPDTQLMIEKTVTTTGYSDIHEPGPGEVWQFVAGSANSTTGLSGTVTTEVDITSTGAGAERVIFIDVGSTSSSDFPLSEITQSPIVYSYGQKLRLRLEGTFTSAIRTFTVIRVR